MHIVVKLLNQDKNNRKIHFESDEGDRIMSSHPVQIDNNDRLQLQLELTAALNELLGQLSQ